jgi:hypothetical protein
MVAAMNCSVLRLAVTANFVPSSPILVTVMMEAIRSSETSLLTRTTQRNIPEDGILHSNCYDSLKSQKYMRFLFSCVQLSQCSRLSVCFKKFITKFEAKLDNLRTQRTLADELVMPHIPNI